MILLFSLCCVYSFRFSVMALGPPIGVVTSVRYLYLNPLRSNLLLCHTTITTVLQLYHSVTTYQALFAAPIESCTCTVLSILNPLDLIDTMPCTFDHLEPRIVSTSWERGW